MTATRSNTVASRTRTTNMLHHSVVPDARLDAPLPPPPPAPRPRHCPGEPQHAPLQLVQVHRLHQHAFRPYRRVAGLGEAEEVAREKHYPGREVGPALLQLAVQLDPV